MDYNRSNCVVQCMELSGKALTILATPLLGVLCICVAM